MRTLQDIQPGQTLGRYEFLVPIAEGGMASVWAARLKGTRGFSKTVAVKTMLPSVSDNPEFEQMFLDEAQIASRIRHPNVVEIMDLGEQDDVLYLVMEWVDGEPLSNLRRAAAKQGGIPRGIAVRVIADACAGLHAAHELKDERHQLVGLVHRDISPQNLLITFDGVVKIVDFGVAKAAGRSTGQTVAGQVKGKPPYMSPEQALGDAVDRRTDVFALGIILYQLTTGKHPFRGESDLVTLQNIVSDKSIVPPRAHDKEYPRSLEAAVMKALDRKRDARFQTCAEFEAALDEVFAKEVSRARTEDIGKFMRKMFGARGDERRAALAEAVRVADERAAGRASLTDIPSTQRALPATSLTPASGTTASVDRMTLDIVPGTDPHAQPVTPFGATIPAPTKRGSRGGVVLAAALALGAVAFFALRRPAEQKAEYLAQPQEPAATQPSAQVAPPSTAAPAAQDSGLVFEPVHETTTTAKPVRRPGHAWRPPPPTPVAAKPPPAEKPPVPPTPPNRSNGFVPPPVTNPGF
jgi:eukaryotic-like serine/threonine-protein kinase